MKAATILLILATGLTNGQLNFEGNPLTENTDYTAEESRLSERTARQDSTATNVTDVPAESSQTFRSHLSQSDAPKKQYEMHPINSTETLIDEAQETDRADEKEAEGSVDQRKIVAMARHLPANSYSSQPAASVNQAEVALNNFLNSKTPEESRLSLDFYLQSRGASQNVPPAAIVNQQQLTQQGLVNQQRPMQHGIVNQQQLAQHGIVNQQQPIAQVNQQMVSSPVNQHLTTQLVQQRQTLQAFPVNQPTYNLPASPADLRSSMSSTPLLQQQALQSYMQGIQARNDAFYPGWQQRVRRIRGKPFPNAQSRGGPGIYVGAAPPVPFKKGGPPVEVIYTKPPGFHRGPPPISNPPVPYEDASAWFPEADHPPPTKDVYWSQLYAQSYDPHYYNYIAKTGKIKPHLYGKLGKYHEEEAGGGIWAELFRGFKKHGLKNMMTPTFLLGMTLPVLTLMLTALVQKRSLSRSDSREFPQEDKIRDYLEEVQRAVECYEKKRRKRDANVDEC